MPKETFAKIPAEKRERLLREAARLFAERGYNQTDMAELADRAGVAKGSLYNYFSSKDDLYIYVCEDGIRRSREAVYGDIDPDWDIYRQVDHIFRSGMRFVLAYPEYLILYTNVSSAGMERFSERLSLTVEKYTADYLKKLLHRGMQRGTVRKDVDVNSAAFLINSLYIVFMTSLVSNHFKIRMKEYLEIERDLDQPAIEKHLRRTTAMIHSLLGPAKESQNNKPGAAKY
jgi:TetR/AcrR family transcriptional regulator